MRRNDSNGILSARPCELRVDVRRGVAVAVVRSDSTWVAWVWGDTKCDKGMYLLVVASMMAASWPSQRNLSNSAFLRVFFLKSVARLVMMSVCRCRYRCRYRCTCESISIFWDLSGFS